jgi:PAS domain S-box-containing protein
MSHDDMDNMNGESLVGDRDDGMMESTEFWAPSFQSSDAAHINFLFEAVWQSAGDAMALSDAHGIVLAANPAYCNLYGYPLDKLVGHSFAVIFPPEFRSGAEREYRRYFVDHVDPQGVEATVVRADGEERLVEVRYSFIEQDGHRMAMLSIIRDVTERARLHKSEGDLVRQKDQFLLAVSHDLKNPITAIRGYAQLLLRRLRSRGTVEVERVTEGLERIEVTSTRMLQMIEGLVDASSMQRGTPLPLHRSPCDLVGLLHEIVNAQRETSDRHQIVVDAPPSLEGMWDRSRLLRVFDNLVSNALKYSPDGGTMRVSVSSESRDTGTDVVVHVSDSGIGISEHDRSRVFDPFFRGANVGEDMPGSGIGLAGVRQIVEMHAGTVDVQSIQGEGSTFTVRLPVPDETRHLESFQP